MTRQEAPRLAPPELDEAIALSRSLLRPAVDALIVVIHEATGRAPDPSRVGYVGSFWLMHLCDRISYERLAGTEAGPPGPDSSTPGSRSARSRIVSLAASRRSPVTVCEPYLKVSMARELMAAVRGRRAMRWRPLPVPGVAAAKPSTDRRRAIAEASVGGSDAENELMRRVALTAPVDLVESFHELGAWSDRAADPALRILYTANAHQSSLSFRHVAHAQRLRGTKVAIHQHGGGYGTDRGHLGEEHDIALSDYFFTWGWTDDARGGKTRPLPTAFPAHDRGSANEGVLLMSLPVTSHFYRLQPFLLPSHVDEAVRETVAFIGDLDGSVNLRLRSSGKDVFPTRLISGAAASVTSDDRRETGAMAASRSALVVHNYLGTSWLETLAMDVPTVCFVPRDVHKFRSSAQPFADALARVGILHESGREAAKFVNSLNGDPGAWWTSAEVQEARRAFVSRYANFSDDWLDAWTAEFERMLSE